MKVKVTITHKETATIDIGALSPRLIKELLESNNGAFNDNWSIADATRDVTWVAETVEVEEVK